jgi:hypothetical protein
MTDRERARLFLRELFGYQTPTDVATAETDLDTVLIGWAAARERYREAVAGAHAIRCTCTPWAPDGRCRDLQALARP